MDFVVLADYRSVIKESKKMDKYLELVSELKKLCNMRVAVVAVIIGALKTVFKSSKMFINDESYSNKDFLVIDA